jgi:hypothetical protein
MAKKDLELVSETHDGKVHRVSHMAAKEKYVTTIHLDDEKWIKAWLDEPLKEGQSYTFLFLTDPETEWTDVEMLSKVG